MKIKLISDTHCEMLSTQQIGAIVHSMDLEDTDYFVMAGDIADYKKTYTLVDYLQECNPDLTIIHINGNHEYYKSYLEKEWYSYKNFHHLNRTMYIDDEQKIVFLGCTLWTNFNNNNPIAMLDAKSGMNDYKYIRWNNGQSKLTPEHIYNLHIGDLKWLQLALTEVPKDYTKIVVTHHKPYFNQGDFLDNLSYCFCSDLINEITQWKVKPDYWFSGHTHKSDIREIDSVKYISNQYGYYFEDEKITHYNENLVIEL